MWRSRGLALACLALALPVGCGRRDEHRATSEAPLSFERLADTTGLSNGAPIVQSFDAYRLPNGAMRVKGRLDLPDGTRVQVAVKRPGDRSAVAMVQVTVQDRRFDSPPMMGEVGPLPEAKYRFEISAHFTPEWQPPDVMLATDDGKSLRGPGITRTRVGGAMFWLVEEMSR
jgi:hypothetical protein